MKPMRVLQELLSALGQFWSRIWFQLKPTAPLELIRMGIGAAMLIHYSLATPYLFLFWGDAGWQTREMIDDFGAGPWAQSLFFYFSAPWQLIAFHALFLFCCAAFIVGWRTSWVKWIVLVGQISYDYRNQMLYYGVDKILAHALLILCVCPIGGAMSLDRVRIVRRAKQADLSARPPTYVSPWVGACTRLLQIQMASLFFYSVVTKLGGDDWWSGHAIWAVFSTEEYYLPWLLNFLASQYWLVNVATYGTILIELAYVFLIWQHATRPYLLAAAIFLHLQFGLLMGLFYFSFVMIMVHLAFVRPEWLTRWGQAWKRRIGDMEMIYDGRCGFCVRSMAWFLAFDGLGQVKVRDFRTNPSPVVSDAQLEKALYLVLPDGRALPGFEAYRYVVLRVPGLWWLIPFFYVPVLSRLIGRPVYNWVAANRSRLSAMRWGRPRPTSK